MVRELSNTIFGDCLVKMGEIDDSSVDLILTDPPYIISKNTGMENFSNFVKGVTSNTKTLDDWDVYASNHKKNSKTFELTDEMKNNYLRYGTIYGKKYAVKTEFGKWDDDFTMDDLELFVELSYQKLRNGGTFIVFFDIWKITYLKDIMEQKGFKQLRFIEWIKTNPQPRNSKVNYLTNCREIALLGIKKSKPTFNSSYDNGIYKYPIYSGKDRMHPTQKSLDLFKDIIKKHSNENDLVLDPFMGSGTTCVAAVETNRRTIGIEQNEEFYKKATDRINQRTSILKFT